MPELLTRIILLALVIYFLWMIILQQIPKVYLTWLGGLFLIVFLLIAFLEPTNDAVTAVADVLLFPFTPLGLSFILLVNAVRQGVKKVEGGQVMAALIILSISSLPLVAYTLTEQAQAAAIARFGEVRASEPAEAIVVLGDTTTPTDPIYVVEGPIQRAENGFSTAFLTRLTIASQLYEVQEGLGETPFVLVSPGFQIQGDEAATSVEDRVEALLINRGVPEAAIIVDTDSRDIRGAALSASELLANEGLKVDLEINDDEQINLVDIRAQMFNIILVAPALRMRRARLAYAQAVNLMEQNVVPLPTDFYAFQFQDELTLARLRDLIPNSEALALTTQVIKEYLIYIYYFVRGWLLNPLDF